MIFKLRNETGKFLPIDFVDVVDALSILQEHLAWRVLSLYGCGRIEHLYPGSKTYHDFVPTLSAASPAFSWNQLREIARATSDTYDVLFIGQENGGDDEQLRRITEESNPSKRFQLLAASVKIAAECVDSGFWRVSIVGDDRAANEFKRTISAKIDVITESERHL